jgi:hypothetical protein
MGKALLVLAFIGLGIVSIGTHLEPNSIVFLLASESRQFQILRGVLEFTILLQLITRPPRHLLFRLLTGVIAASTMLWIVFSTYNGQILPWDSLSILGASIAIMITAIERKAHVHMPLHQS